MYGSSARGIVIAWSLRVKASPSSQTIQKGTISVFFEIDELKEQFLLICTAYTNVPTAIFLNVDGVAGICCDIFDGYGETSKYE